MSNYIVIAPAFPDLNNCDKHETGTAKNYLKIAF